MRIITACLVVECPVAEVFAFVTDARNNPLWQSTSGLQESRQMPESPVGVGTQISEIWHVMGTQARVTSEVTAYEPAKRYTRHLLSGSSPITQGTQMFEAAANGTRWTFTMRFQADGTSSAAESALADQLRRALETNMAEAKALLERRAVENAR